MADNIGDSIDLGGKLPQFKAFASIAYNELNASKLVWIRVADPKAMVLDDIQYATKTEVHAYQVKWSNLEDPTTFTYLNLQGLLKDIVASWQKLRVEYASENKPFFVHLLTNREPSSHDQVKDAAEVRAGNFSGFLEEVWMKLKNKKSIDVKWQTVANEFEASTGLAKNEFEEFVQAFDMRFCYNEIDFATERIDKGKQNQDLLDFTMFLFEKVADKTRKVLFEAADIIKGLNWEARFNTIFNHELRVDPSRYCTIEQTVAALNVKVDVKDGGYVFLSGGPGSGKSSLLAQWSKTRKERVVHYFAFDFTDPASSANTPDRGDATHLLFDLVQQLKESGVWPSDTVMHKDKDFLRQTFGQQLELLKKEYAATGRKTIIVIDGLDHVPREYHTALQSFIAELPNPATLSDGIVIVLGSQTYILADLPHTVKAAYDKKDMNVGMAAMSKQEVNWYVDHSKIRIKIDATVKEKLFEISQGHPLYLSYLINKIDEVGSAGFLDDEAPLEGSIEDYYNRCWQPIKQDTDLVNFLGLVARINGDISIDFISQWPFDDRIKRDFNQKTSFLFQKDATGWHFFHNSFRQFLITQSALNPIDESYDENRHKKMHQTLGAYYSDFNTGTPWQKLYHFYMGGQEKEFIQAATQQSFFEQYESFRPHEEIENDILHGVRLSKKLHDPYLLGRYIFALNELNSRVQVIAPNSFIEEFIQIGKIDLAKQLIRNNRKLLVNKRYALKAARWFFDLGETTEARLLFALAEPQEVTTDGIRLQLMGHDREDISTLKNWASAFLLFSTAEDFLSKIAKVELLDDKGNQIDSNTLRNRLIYRACETLIEKNRPDELETLLKEIHETDFVYTRRVLWRMTEYAHEQGNDAQARAYLQRLLDVFKGLVIGDFMRMQLADLIYRVTKNMAEIETLIGGIGQPSAVDYHKMNGDRDLSEFSDRLLFNKMLNLTGKGQSITDAVPNARKADQGPATEFERNICRIVKLYTDGVQGVPLMGNLKIQLSPIIRFFYGHDQKSDHNLYKLKMGASTYFKWLVDAMSVYGSERVEELMQIFGQEFAEFPATWSVEVRRSIYVNGYRQGAGKTGIAQKLEAIEKEMLDGQDPTGRAEQCTSQAQGWIELEEFGRAESCMHMALHASLGIGYRKDSQYGTWVEWLVKILSIEPEKAEARIKMFALHLPVLRQTSERSQAREGSAELLEATLNHNQPWGLQLFRWLMEQGLIEMYAGIGAVLKAVIRQASDKAAFDPALDLYKELYLVMATNFDKELLRSTLKKADELSTDFQEVALLQIIEAIRINALQKTREYYYQGIKTFLEERGYDTAPLTGLTDLSATAQKKINSSNSLTVRDPYENLSEEEVLGKVKDGAAFIQWFAKEDKINSYFSWVPVFEMIEADISEDDLKEIYKHCNKGKRDSELLAKMTERAMMLGAKELAKQFAEASLVNSSASGWPKWYDGGSRQAACKAIIATDPEKGFDRSLEKLADDVLESDYVSEFHKSLSEILPVICKSPNDQKMWPEIESFLSRLLGGEPGIEIEPFESGDDKDVLFDFIYWLCRFSNRSLRGVTTSVIARHLGTNDLLQQRIKRLAKGNDNEQDLLTEILSVCSVNNKEMVSEIFLEELQKLATADNFFIRRKALAILEKLGIKDVPTIPKKALPLVYELKMPVSKGFKKTGNIPGDKVVSDTEKLYQLLGTYTEWLALIADHTDFEEGAILTRWGQLMEGAGMDRTTAAYEEKVRSHNSEIEWEFSFPRPRYEVITQSLGRLIAELKDAQAMEDEDFSAQYGIYDNELQAGIKLSPRPEWILPMQEGKLFLSGWVNDIDSSARLHGSADRTTDGWIVAGEQTTLINLSWGKPTETISSYMVLGGDAPNDHQDPPVEHLHRCLVTDYHDASGCNDESYVVVFNDQDFRNPGKSAEWIAFNPALAEMLRWKASDREMFAWEDANGELMAFSRYWRDGNIEMQVPKHDNEVGEGWYVLISERALAQLDSIQTPFFSLKRRITRETFYNGYKSDTFDQLLDEWE